MPAFVTASVTRKGGREINQDAFGAAEQNGASCWVVADGLGGHQGGQVAASVAVESILASFRQDPRCAADALAAHFTAAHTAIQAAQQRDPALAEMRTTAVALVADGTRAIWGHLGDSRLYHIEGGRILSQTEDHSVPQAMAAAGEIAREQIRFHEDRNRLLRSIGKEGDLKPAIRPQPALLHRGDAFLLCTDGFWELVNETEMEADLAKSEGPREWLIGMEARLVERAPEGTDNYTALAIWYTLATAPLPQPLTARITLPQAAAAVAPAAAPATGIPGRLVVGGLLAVICVLSVAAIALLRKPDWFGIAKVGPPPQARFPRVHRPKNGLIYETLAAALQDAGEGETLILDEGDFDAHDLAAVTRSISLKGAGAGRSRIHLRNTLVFGAPKGGLADLTLTSDTADPVLRMIPSESATVERIGIRGKGSCLIDKGPNAVAGSLNFDPPDKGLCAPAAGKGHEKVEGGKTPADPGDKVFNQVPTPAPAKPKKEH